ncbi:hypothetical protein E2320_011376 [Naja naja]|nr:hypothetical protein E2320_011376 [Naja naja]
MLAGEEDSTGIGLFLADRRRLCDQSPTLDSRGAPDLFLSVCPEALLCGSLLPGRKKILPIQPDGRRLCFLKARRNIRCKGESPEENMIIQKEFCGGEQISTSYLGCLLYLLEEWTGVEHLEEYLNYLITFLLVLLLIGFLLPLVIFLFFFISVIFVYIYKRKTNLNEGLNDFSNDVKQLLATAWYVHARIWNGYEVHGLEKLPDGPALLIHYHGATF